MCKCDVCEKAELLIEQLRCCPYGSPLGSCVDCSYVIKRALHEAAGRAFESFASYKNRAVFGIAVVEDPSMPPGEAELRGKNVARLTGVTDSQFTSR